MDQNEPSLIRVEPKIAASGIGELPGDASLDAILRARESVLESIRSSTEELRASNGRLEHSLDNLETSMGASNGTDGTPGDPPLPLERESRTEGADEVSNGVHPSAQPSSASNQLRDRPKPSRDNGGFER